MACRHRQGVTVYTFSAMPEPNQLDIMLEYIAWFEGSCRVTNYCCKKLAMTGTCWVTSMQPDQLLHPQVSLASRKIYVHDLQLQQTRAAIFYGEV